MAVGYAAFLLYFGVLEAEAAPRYLSANCTSFDGENWVPSENCTEVVRLIDCDARMVCYISQGNIFCIPAVDTLLSTNSMCRADR